MWPIALMCHILSVHRNGFHHYQKKKQKSDPAHQQLLELTKKVAESSHYTYGSRRMKKALNTLGYSVGRTRQKVNESSRRICTL